MDRTDGFWTRIHADLREGRTPVCAVTYADNLVRPMKRPPGRPKGTAKKDPASPYADYVAADLLGGKRRPECLNPTCHAKLTKLQYVCSDECRLKAVRFLKTALFFIEGKKVRVTPAPKLGPLPNVAYGRPLPQAGDKLMAARAAKHGLVPKL